MMPKNTVTLWLENNIGSAKVFAEFFVENVSVLTFFSCVIGVVAHFILEYRRKSPIKKRGLGFQRLVIRVFAASNIPMVSALLACAAFNDLLLKLEAVTSNMFAAAVAVAYVTYLSFSD